MTDKLSDGWKRVGPTIKTTIDRREVILKSFIQPDGRHATFATFNDETSRSGAVIALTPDKKVIVSKQFRPGPEKLMYEIPGGGIKEGEDPRLGVMRELREETGYVSDEVRFLGTVGRDAYTNGTWHYYIAHNCILDPRGSQPDEGEYIDVELLTIDDFIAKSKTDLMTDPTAVLMAYDQLMIIQNGHGAQVQV